MNDRPLFLVSALMRALSHKVRTPLSVISNDLQFYREALAAEDYARSMGKVQEISDLLDLASVIDKDAVQLTRLSLPQVLGASSLAASVAECGDELFIEGNEKVLLTGFSMLSRLLIDASVTFKISDHMGYLSCKCHAPVDLRGKPESIRRFSSFTEVFSGVYGQEQMLPPLIDSIFLFHDCMITLSHQEGDLLSVIVFTAIS